MTSKLEKLLKDVKGIRKASDALKYDLLTTPFSTVNNLIGGIPRGRFTIVAG